ncbi:hypothetical protein, conserved [Plasmodium ovale]|uniref:PIR protein n=1 Tax=Plasmodium ovale TaxID=36330 RepID=A0A1C3KK39_PLAOA|nr:hypothetical protein, conserved [Plasmodium ovale]
MSPYGDKFSFDEFMKKHKIFDTLKFAKIYKVFNDETTSDQKANNYCKEIKRELTFPYNDEKLMLNFCNVLYKIIVKYNTLSDDFFEGIPKDDKMYCISMKYWLYEKLLNLGPLGLKVDKILEKWKTKLEEKILATMSYPCTFNELDMDAMDKIRSIYTFVLLYYKHLGTFNNTEDQNIECKYIDYVGRGLKEYYESLKRCSKREDNDIYCKEFNEFQEIYKENNLYWKTSKEDKKYSYSETNTVNCALKIESNNKPVHISYWNDREKLHLSNEPMDSLNSSIIPASSAIGTAAGISAFLLYLFKFTNIGSLFGLGNKKDNTMLLNVDQGIHDFTSPISEPERNNFGNNEYKISYYS